MTRTSWCDGQKWTGCTCDAKFPVVAPSHSFPTRTVKIPVVICNGDHKKGVFHTSDEGNFMDSESEKDIEDTLSKVRPSVMTIIERWAVSLCRCVIYYPSFCGLLIVTHHCMMQKVVDFSFPGFGTTSTTPWRSWSQITGSYRWSCSGFWFSFLSNPFNRLRHMEEMMRVLPRQVHLIYTLFEGYLLYKAITNRFSHL